MDRSKIAKENFLNGFNCSQSVVLAFKDLIKEEELDSIIKVSSSFGGGLSRLRETCGTVSAIGIVLGYIFGYTDDGKDGKKQELYSRVQEVARKFEKENGTIICRELLGLKKGENDDSHPTQRTEEFYDKRPCKDLCAKSAKLIEEYLKKENIL